MSSGEGATMPVVLFFATLATKLALAKLALAKLVLVKLVALTFVLALFRNAFMAFDRGFRAAC
jgi:hypothetical protein